MNYRSRSRGLCNIEESKLMEKDCTSRININKFKELKDKGIGYLISHSIHWIGKIKGDCDWSLSFKVLGQ